MDAIYNRPFKKLGSSSLSIGGYVESDVQYNNTSGITNGDQFQFRRFSLFVSSTIAPHIKFLSEIEYEDDPSGDAGEAAGAEFGVEYAALDIEFNPLLNLRGGMILNPIGGFNENHDGPKYEFTDRPIAMTQMLPDTWNNPGFGLYGKKYSGHWMYGYEAYVTGGFNDSIINNSQGKTFLPAAKSSITRFNTSASGEPLHPPGDWPGTVFRQGSGRPRHPSGRLRPAGSRFPCAGPSRRQTTHAADARDRLPFAPADGWPELRNARREFFPEALRP